MNIIFTRAFSVLVLFFFAVSGGTVLAQSKSGTVTGTIKTSDGKPAAYVNVGLKNANKFAQTNEDGKFTIKNVKPGNYTIKVSAIGRSAQEQEVTVTSGQTADISFSISESSSQLDEVNISGYKSVNKKPVSLSKIAIAPRDLPQAVQIIGTQVIQDQQMNRLSDVLKNVNGVAYGENRGGVSGETFFARGYSLGGNNVFKNGARASSGGMPEASTLESVEVLKGSAALLYGGVSGGAVVNLVTKKPKFEYGGEVSLRAGSYNLYKPMVDVYGPISKKFAFRVIGTTENADNYRDVVKTKRIYVNPSLLYKISDKTNILLQGDFLKSDYTPDFGVGTTGNKIPDIRRGAYLGTNWAYNKTNTTTGQINLNHEFSDNWKIIVIGSVQGYNRSYFSSERPAADASGVWYRALTRSRNREFTYNQQANLNGTFKTGKISHTLLVGADADQSSTTSYGFTNPNLLKNVLNNNAAYYDMVNILDPATFDIPSNFNMPQTDMLSDTYTMIYRMGAFVQDLVSITDQFKVLAGVRWTFQKTPSPLTTANTTGIKTPGAADKIDKAWSPKVGLIYQPLKTTSIYASYSNNFTSNTGINIATDAPMGPSIIDQYEAGIKNDFLDGKLSANVTAYKIKNSNLAQAALADPSKREFSGATASDGVEVDLTGTIVNGLNFLAGYSYNFMRYTRTLETGTVEGERLVGTTKNTVNGTLFYTMQDGTLKGLKFGVSSFYTGKRNGGFNTSKVPPTPTTTRAGLIPVGGFTTLDLTAGYSWKKLSLLAKVSNITDELNYFVHENYSINPIPPRQFMTTLSYKF